MFLQEIPSQPSCKDLFLLPSGFMLDKNKKETLKISLFSTPLSFQELVTSTVFNGYTVSKIRTRWMFIVPTILISPNPNEEEERKGIIFKKVFVLLISRRSASSLCLLFVYCISVVGLICNTGTIGKNLLLNTIITIEASKAALIVDT